VNEDPNAQLVRELKEELKFLEVTIFSICGCNLNLLSARVSRIKREDVYILKFT